MSNLLKRAETGIIDQPLFAVLFGEPGTGKTTFLSQFPKPFIVDIERGSKRMNVDRFLPENLDEVIQVTKELTASDFETIGFDSMDILESMVWKQICAENGWISVEDPGYGKGYVVALKKWETLMGLWDKMRQTKNVVLICHSEIKTVNDPTQLNAYDKVQIKLNKHASGLIRAKVDMILYAQKEQILKTEKGAKKAKVVGEEYTLWTQGGAGFEGKNRFRMPEKMALSFTDFWDAYRKGSKETPVQVIAEIEAFFPKIAPEKIDQIKAFIEINKANMQQLRIGLNRAMVLSKESKVEEKKDASEN